MMRWFSKWIVVLCAVGCCAGALYLSLALGINNQVGFEDALIYIARISGDHVFVQGTLSPDIRAILDVRLLRGMVGLVSGAAFAISGVALQGSLRNPLTDAGILGIGSGAIFAILFCIVVFGISTPLLYSVGALVGALVVAGIVLLIASRNSFTRQPSSMIIIGAAITALLSAINHALTLHGGWRIQGYLRWTIGLCTLSNTQELCYAGIFLLIITGFLCMQARSLDMIQMGDDTASALGVPVVRTRLLVCVGSAMSCAIGVILAGPLPFLGLMVPHIIRSCGIRTHTALFFWAAILGGLLTLAADVAGRLIFSYFEIPAGVVLAILGFAVLCSIVHYKGLNASC